MKSCIWERISPVYGRSLAEVLQGLGMSGEAETTDRIQLEVYQGILAPLVTIKADSLTSATGTVCRAMTV